MTAVAVSRDLLEAHVRRLYDLGPEVPFDSLNEPLASWVSYAMDTVQRGRWVLEELRPHGLRPGFRFLDAGCAYGGFLAAAAEWGAGEVVGVDSDARYVAVARDLLASAGVEGRVEVGSLSDAALLAGLGIFDVIACADVIEHVDDVTSTLANLAWALAPGGMLYLATPNPRSPSFVRRDPHFQLFGITLLPPADARAYARAVNGHNWYDIGDFGSLAGYRALLERDGLEIRLINPPADAEAALLQLRSDVDALEAEAGRFADPRLPPKLERKVRGRALDLVGEVRARLAELDGGVRGWWPWRRRVRAGAPSRVAADYAIQTWHILGRRPRARPPSTRRRSSARPTTPASRGASCATSGPTGGASSPGSS